MECKACGAVIETGDSYCEYCSSRLKRAGVISKNELFDLLKKEVKFSGETDKFQEFQQLICKLSRNEFKRVEIQKSSAEELASSCLDETNILDVVKELKNGGLKITCQNYDFFVKLTLAALINEFDAIQNEIGDIKASLHDDRKAKIYTAFQQYQRAVQSEDAADQTDGFRSAANSCLEGINELRMEMDRLLDFFSKLPKSTFKKLFCGVKLRDAQANLNQVQEAFHFYCNAVRLMIQVDLGKNEIKRLLSTLKDERSFLKEIQRSDGYRRLLEVDDDNAEKWRITLRELAADMYCIENYIGTESVYLNIVEEL